MSRVNDLDEMVKQISKDEPEVEEFIGFMLLDIARSLAVIADKLNKEKK